MGPQPLRLQPLSCPLVNPRPPPASLLPQPPLPSPLRFLSLLPRLPALPLEGLPHLAWSCTSVSFRGCSSPISPATARPQGFGGLHTAPVVPPLLKPTPLKPTPLKLTVGHPRTTASPHTRRCSSLCKAGRYRWSGVVSSVRSHVGITCLLIQWGEQGASALWSSSSKPLTPGSS